MENNLDYLCYEFFREFSRYEYCLKACGLHHKIKDAKADWDEYAKQVSETINNTTDPELISAIAYFKEHPPKKQIIKDGSLIWDDSLPQEKDMAKFIFLLIRRVRNNLFHGGKFNGKWFEPERSEALLQHGLVILRCCGEEHIEVSKAYSGIA
ncbi:TPA: hypothetical protein ACYEOW_005660 [Raoultella terrigena]|uniref:Apea-like HEPN domain-containing protein n=1 Tax=Raoultella terrigena TaxID=577 RepID=A0AAP9XS71_RAOTE|nr:hypothetical protein [Raoultella terrigena]QPF09916.1 hypothetical protein IMO34_05720 [Raoultella terrigena]HAT3636033.1 hypothetical protein [Raoultella ornithinolytica]